MFINSTITQKLSKQKQKLRLYQIFGQMTVSSHMMRPIPHNSRNHVFVQLRKELILEFPVLDFGLKKFCKRYITVFSIENPFSQYSDQKPISMTNISNISGNNTQKSDHLNGGSISTKKPLLLTL